MNNKKNRIHYPYIPTIVIDDFFETPEMVRSFALSQEFFKGDRGHWPGVRTDFLNNISKELSDLVQFNILKQLPQFKKFEKFESTFHLSGKNYVKGWVHDDAPDLNIAGFVYMSPNPPENSGTSFFEDGADVMMANYLQILKDDVSRSPEDPPVEAFNKYRDEHRSWFKKSLSVDNVFNRAIIFDPRTWHAGDNFFGTTKEDSRLVLVFFARAV